MIIQKIFLLFYLAFATGTDFDKHKIPNWLTYPMIILFFLTAIATSIINKTFMPLADTLISFLMGLFFAVTFVKAKMWAAGDSKMLLTIFTGLPYPLLLGRYMIYLFLVIFAWLIGVSLIRYFRKRSIKVESPLAFCFLLAYVIILF